MTTENNKIIAEFMYGKEVKKDTIHFPSIVFKEGKNYFSLEELKFHSDWNWLMEVVEKIEEKGFDVFINTSVCRITDVGEDRFEDIETFNSKFKRQAVYAACVEFIKWYNEQEVK